jgi:probable HAF family extracellular repeat protein
MKPIDNRGIRSLIMAPALSIGLGFVTHASAQVQEHSYLIDLKTRSATDLGDLQATAINDAGQVVGNYGAHTVITGPNGVGMTNLDMLGAAYSSAIGINNAGQVTGDYRSSPESSLRSFITGPNGVGMKDLGMLPYGDFSTATGINNAGRVVGTVCCVAAMAGQTAFITGPDGVGMTRIGGDVSYAYDINDAGQVVGYMRTGPDTFPAFITGPNGVGMKDLGMLPYGDFSIATGINNAGQVVGSFDTADEHYSHAFITGPDGVGMTDLGTLGGNNSTAMDINNAGQVVGSSDTADEHYSHAFITGPDGIGMTDLNSLVHLSGGLVINNAFAINNLEQVLVSASIPAASIPAVPEPKSYALMLAGLVLTGVLVRRKQKADLTEETISL